MDHDFEKKSNDGAIDSKNADGQTFFPSGHDHSLQEDHIIVKALEYAAAHDWRLPTYASGEIEGLPGQTWNAWNLALKNCSRGLKRTGLKGLSHLFRIYGLRIGRRGNKTAIKRAWRSIQEIGLHGLVANQADMSLLSEDLIITTALEFAAAHHEKLPTKRSGRVKGFPGQTWKHWDYALRNCIYGLTREGLTGLFHLFQLYGIKIGRRECKSVIKTALKSLRESHSHGLVAGNSNARRLSEDIILTKALAYAAAHNWKLPSHEGGEIEGLPGQTWNVWQVAVRHCLRGLNREGLKGISHLFHIYGLKTEGRDNQLLIREAWERHQKTNYHGLLCYSIYSAR
jgi:hypothetical protein